jgi:hypothetical protein
MSNVKFFYNEKGRIRKGCKLERLNRFVLNRPLRTTVKAVADEYKIETSYKKRQEKNIYIYFKKKLK